MSTRKPRPEPTTMRLMVSADGTKIEVRTVGNGPALILIPGVLSTADDYVDFANALADRFTVHTIQRRGRGMRGAQGDHYGMDREREDVEALQAETGARFLVGHSYGGLITLQAARNNSTFDRIAVYEPGVSVRDLIPMTWVPRYRTSLAEHHHLDALAVFSAATGPALARQMPVWMMKPMLLLSLPPKRRHTMYELLETNLREHQEVARFNDMISDYGQINAPVLPMSGGRSRLDYVPPALDALRAVLPVSTSYVFPKLDHFGPDRSGPSEVARIVTDFLSESA